VGAFLAGILMIGLAPVAFGFGSGRLRNVWVTTTWDVGLLVGLLFLPWYVVARLVDAPTILVPLSMLVLACAYSAGWAAGWRRHLRRRRARERSALN